jgi:hypothetical protein
MGHVFWTWSLSWGLGCWLARLAGWLDGWDGPMTEAGRRAISIEPGCEPELNIIKVQKVHG